MNFIWVFLGGGLGSMCRYGISLLLKQQQLNFPIATFSANVISCIILGYLIGLQLKSGIGSQQQLLLMTGFCGGFSTFSTFSGEIVQLFQQGQSSTALFYIAASLLVCVFCIWLGMMMSRA